MNQRGVLACCAVCKTETTRRCSRCLDIYYCNREHQREDWKRHKSECLPKLTEEEPRKDNHITQEISSRKVENSPEPKENIKCSKKTHLPNNTKSSSKKSHGNVQQKEGSATATNSKQTGAELRKNKNGATTSDQSVNKIAELLKTGSIVKSNVVYSKDLKKDSAITYEGSSEQEILSETAQQLNNVEFSKSVNSSPNILKSVNRVGDKMPVIPSYVTEPPPRMVHKEYPADGSLKNSIHNNYLMDSTDPCYEICQRVIRDMTQYGVCVLDNFLGRDKGLYVLNEVLDMHRSGIFTAGQLVSNPGSTEAKTIRSDNITWIDGKEPHCSSIGTLINQVDSIILRANKMQNNGKMGDYNINGRTKAMVACYPGSGSHYVKHVDNPNKDGRCITAIYYLNLDWDVKRNGGLLRVFPEGTDTVANIQPIFDRMLFFWSDRRNPHEVQPAYATRYAITLWYFDAVEREEALRLYKSRGQPPTK